MQVGHEDVQDDAAEAPALGGSEVLELVVKLRRVSKVGTVISSGQHDSKFRPLLPPDGTYR
ncbi:hypothetical protein ACFVY4_34130 [Streptomyces sp. NPDC058299]|uniref:hypothetical protein n=1 Tax=Streptomyces sp. NPDC058299 TaxID=3346435 RepID=UPI0036E49E19